MSDKKTKEDLEYLIEAVEGLKDLFNDLTPDQKSKAIFEFDPKTLDMGFDLSGGK